MKLAFIILITTLININSVYAEAEKATVKDKKTTDNVDLKTVYKREFAFLQAQKRALAKRLINFKHQSKQAENKLEVKISGLERQTIKQSSNLQLLEDQLAEADRKENALEERSEVLDMTFQQATSSLKNYGIDLATNSNFQKETDSEKIHLLFSDATQLLTQLGRVKTHPGQFFLQNGKQVKGKIIEIGNIASYGVSQQGRGALVPAGADSMKLWNMPAAEVAEGFAQGNMPKHLKIFLYESRDKAVDEKVDKTWGSIIDSAGIIGWVIVAMGGLGVIFIIIRTILLRLNSSNCHQIEEQIISLVNKGRYKEAEQACQQAKGAIARVLRSTLKHAKDDRDHMDDVITEAILHESGTLNKFSSVILVIASVSPLLGLLGTVTGMISTFDIITEFGTGDPKLLSGGISIALVTTELGLIVAIPTLLIGTLLSSWSELIKLDMETMALKVSNILLSEPTSLGDNTVLGKAA